MLFEIVEGEVWLITRGKKAGKTPARPERREFMSRDPEIVRGYSEMGERLEAARQTRVVTKASPDIKPLAQPPTWKAWTSSAANPDRGEDTTQLTRPSRTKLPGWPRGLREDWAAAYVGLSVTSFRAVTKSDGVPVVWLTARHRVYLLEDLDAWLDRKAGRNPHDSANWWNELSDTSLTGQARRWR